MGTNGRQWDTMTFHGLTKPFQGAEFRDFPPAPRASARLPSGMAPWGATNSTVLWLGKGGFGAISRRSPGGAGKKSQTACKPGSVPASAGDGHSSGTPVTGRLARPTRASARKPACRTSIAWGPACRPYLVLLPVGFTLPPPLPGARCALTAPFHPCHGPEPVRRFAFCGTFPGVAPAGR